MGFAKFSGQAIKSVLRSVFSFAILAAYFVALVWFGAIELPQTWERELKRPAAAPSWGATGAGPGALAQSRASTASCYTSPSALRDQLAKGNYSLTVVGLFKDEGLMLRQWVEHHIGEGVDHFVLVDNNDPGKGSREACSLQPLVEAGVVTMIQNDGEFIQLPEMNRLLKLFAPRSKWMMSIDVDEFVYARPDAAKPADSITEFLDRLPKTRSVVSIPRKSFLITSYMQAASVVTTSRIRQTFAAQGTILPKWIVRASSFEKYTIHWPLTAEEFARKECYAVSPDESCMNHDGTPSTKPASMDDTIHLNHYRMRSIEGFLTKLGRSAHSKGHAENRYKLSGLQRIQPPDENESESVEVDDELSLRHIEKSRMYTQQLDIALCCGRNAGGSAPMTCPHHVFSGEEKFAQTHYKAWVQLCNIK